MDMRRVSPTDLLPLRDMPPKSLNIRIAQASVCAGPPAVLVLDCSDETLMRRFCATLDEGVFRAITDRYYDRALRVAEDELANGATAFDAVQETFIRVVRHRKRYNPEKPFSPWFFAILRNVCADFRRKEARYSGALRRFADLVLSGRGDDAAKERAGGLLECLGEKDVRLLKLRYVHGMPVSDIAGKIGCSGEVAKKRIQRILRRLQAYSSVPT